MLEHREGPETCNTYNMLRLTEQLFDTEPKAEYADYYERALFNHILSAINPNHPGYVYFTPIRPGHYRVYSEPGQGFWCCVGTGMENPGKYGEFIYAHSKEGVYVNLFIASELTDPALGLKLRQNTAFPDEEQTKLTLTLDAPKTFTLFIRYPAWVAPGALSIKVNGAAITTSGAPCSYIPIKREWKNNDTVEVHMPMRTTVVGLPDASPWYAILHGRLYWPHQKARTISSVCEQTTLAWLISPPAYNPSGPSPHPADDSRRTSLARQTRPKAGPLHFRITDISDPSAPEACPWSRSSACTTLVTRCTGKSLPPTGLPRAGNVWPQLSVKKPHGKPPP